MRDIKVTDGISGPLHILLCGLPSSGKTFFSATAEKPLFLADASEGGYRTIAQMDRELWWNPAEPPTVWGAESMDDIPIALAKLEKSCPFKTIVIDPLSIYIDRFLAELMAKQIHKDDRAYYGDLGAHLRSLILRVHALPVNVIWCCHVKADGSEVNGPAIAGQMSTKFPAYCDFKWLMNIIPSTPVTPAIYELRTAPYRSWTFLGSRGRMYDPMLPSMKCIYQALGLPQQPVSPAVPGFPTGLPSPYPKL